MGLATRAYRRCSGPHSLKVLTQADGAELPRAGCGSAWVPRWGRGTRCDGSPEGMKSDQSQPSASHEILHLANPPEGTELFSSQIP